MRFISIADNGVIDFTSKDIAPEQLSDSAPQTTRKAQIKRLVYFIHNVFNEKRN